ncbi:hypothetical protein [Inhella proteolytica]|uniref:Tetratricopeptide repeat protein n=1 Tax=Inhella proteolytica TaxID=2795029 RepID=A0A931IZ21_9BURK|nr:hypothetical protein [Inhella proteolytica]MBH9575663.1 hypothetical protein [Inhella proteolytica]
MPFIGLGLHFLLAIYCAVHALRNGQPMYWLIILFSFPVLGSVVYVLAIMLPHSRVQRQAGRALRAVGQALDPGREVREAREALDTTPTAQNQMRLAAALLAAGQLDEAATCYQQCLQGPFANDADVRWGAAQVDLLRGQAGSCLAHLDVIAERAPGYRAEAVSLLRARALAAQGQHGDALRELDAAVARFGSFEAKAERTIWAWQRQHPQAAHWQQELDLQQKRWNAHTKQLNAALLARLQAVRPR